MYIFVLVQQSSTEISLVFLHLLFTRPKLWDKVRNCELKSLRVLQCGASSRAGMGQNSLDANIMIYEKTVVLSILCLCTFLGVNTHLSIKTVPTLSF